MLVLESLVKRFGTARLCGRIVCVSSMCMMSGAYACVRVCARVHGIADD